MRKLTMRVNQRFFLNVGGKIEAYRFVQANHMFDGSVAITARQMLGDRRTVPLLASRGLIEREVSQVVTGRVSGAVLTNAQGYARRISFWCGIYFTRRRAKTGISTHQPWLESALEITAGPMNEREAIFARLAASIDRMVLNQEAALKAELLIQPTAKLSDLMNEAVGSTVPSGRTPTYNELSDLAYQMKQNGEYERPVDRKPIFEMNYGMQIRNNQFPIIKVGI